MAPSNARRLPLYVIALLCLGLIVASAAIYLYTHKKWQPESLAMAPDGTLIVGSASSPFVYRVNRNSSSKTKLIDASAEGKATFFFGVLSDLSGNTLWVCQLTPIPGTNPARLHSALRSFDLVTAAPRLRWELPGDSSMCNDLTLGPDRTLYFTDTTNGRIYRLASGASAATLLLEHPALVGIDGITILDGRLYVNNVFTNRLYRIPTDEAGKGLQPVEVQLDQPLKGPDGMRAANGRLIVAENGSGRISALTISGDHASVQVLREGLQTPTGVEPAGDTIWIAERAAGRTLSIPIPR